MDKIVPTRNVASNKRIDQRRAALLLLLTGALALRVIAALDTFWLDEIWTYFAVQHARGPWEVITGLPHSNNHVLNSLFVYLMGEQEWWFLYRLLSLLTGTAAVWLIGLMAAAYGKPAQLFSVALAAVSLPLVLYSGEARGYAPLVFFAVLAYLSSPEWTPRPAVQRIVIFCIACILGLMSHLTFAFILAGLGISWFISRVSNRMDISRMAREFITCFMPPIVICGYFFIGIWSQVYPEIGQSIPPLDAAAQMALLSIGIDEQGPFRWLYNFAVILMFLFGLWFARSRRVSLLVITVVVPTLIFIVINPPYLFPRYFLVLTPFFLIALSILLQHLWKKSGVYRGLALGIFLTAMVAGAVQLTAFYRYGHGDYPAAIQQIIKLAGGRPFTIGSDHDFRNGMLLNFYARYERNGSQMTVIERSSLLATPPDFYIKHSFDESEAAWESLSLGDASYKLIGEYPYSGHSGWSWWTYRKL